MIVILQLNPKHPIHHQLLSDSKSAADAQQPEHIRKKRHAYSFLFITELGANSLIYRANFPLFDSLI